MRVCVTGSFGGGDIGDDAMVFPHLYTLDSIGVKREDIWLVGFKPEYMTKHFSHPLKRCISSETEIPTHVIESTDVLLVTGGGTINTRAQDGYSVRRMWRLVTSFAKKGIPIFMSGQTIGPLGINRDHDALAKEIVESVDVLTVRDKSFSRTYLEKIGAKPKELIETLDDATCIDPHPGDLPVELPEGKKAAVNITLYTFDTPEKKNAVEAVCRWLSGKGFHVLLVPHHPWDFEAMHSLNTVPNSTLIDTRDWHGTMTKRLFKECDIVVAGRYHAMVFAMTAKVPCVGMAGNEYSWIKQMGFARQVGMESMIVAPDNVTNVDMIVGMIETSRTMSVDPKLPVSFAAFKDWAYNKGLL